MISASLRHENGGAMGGGVGGGGVGGGGVGGGDGGLASFAKLHASLSQFDAETLLSLTQTLTAAQSSSSLGDK